jgi:hypothetical protein
MQKLTRRLGTVLNIFDAPLSLRIARAGKGLSTIGVSESHWSTELIQDNIKSEFGRPLTLENSLLNPLACGFAHNLRCENILVNKKNYVLLLTVNGVMLALATGCCYKSIRVLGHPSDDSYGVVNFFTALVTPSLLPLASIDSTV